MEAYERLEHELAAWSGTGGLYRPEQVVACSSGTAALHLALEAFRLPAGSEVIVPDFTMVACPRAVVLAGLTPVFVDCDERLLMENRLLGSGHNYLPHEAVTPDKTSAIMSVHVYGRHCEMGELTWLAEDVPCKLVEDLAEAHGVPPHPGTDAACWSFFRNKIIGGEEGGAVAFCDVEHAALARQLRCLGFTDAHDFQHVPRGHNYRMSNLHAEEILGNFEMRYWCSPGDKEPWWQLQVRNRREVEAWYDELCPAAWRMPPRDAPWVYDLRIPNLTPATQTAVVRSLNAEGIAARHAFKPMSQQEEFRGCRLVRGERHVAARMAGEVIYLPLTPGSVTREVAGRAFEVVRSYVGQGTPSS